MRELAPILITVYDRLEHLRRCVDSLERNELARRSALYIASDGAARPESAERIETVREYIGSIEGFAKVVPIFHDGNVGAVRNAAEARDLVLARHDSFIRLEDDIVVSRHFLRYLNDGLEIYESDATVLAICAYTVPMKFPRAYKLDVYRGKRFCPWGFAIWKDRWSRLDVGRWDRYSEVMADRSLRRKFEIVGDDYLSLLRADSEGSLDANDVRICYQQVVEGLDCVFPTKTLSSNIGFDGSGMHCSSGSRFDVALYDEKDYPVRWPVALPENRRILRRFMLFQNGETEWSRAFRKLNRALRSTFIFQIAKRLIKGCKA